MAQKDHSEPAVSKLFQPVEVGDLTLGHRVVLAPLTRYRANIHGVHSNLAVEYYAQRASFPGTLLIAEATPISRATGLGSPHSPGVWNEEQVAAWKEVVEAVHANGSFIFLQLWILGRATAPVENISEQDSHSMYVSASDIPLIGRRERPRALSIVDIKGIIAEFVQAAQNAVFGAGFDGVEIHGANGYLVDQFIQDMSNNRTDDYGGSIENRCRFALEVVNAVAQAVGETKTAIRISPWSSFQDMRMPDPIPTFSYLVSRLAADHPRLAYLHVIEPGIVGNDDCIRHDDESNEFIRKIWSPRPLITAGGYSRDPRKALEVAEETNQLIAFGRAFISNPDLPQRLLRGIPLTEWNRAVFYPPEDPHGYIDYTPASSNSQETSVAVDA